MPINDYIRTRLAQIASGDYKACGHTAEQVAADALQHLNAIEPVGDDYIVRIVRSCTVQDISEWPERDILEFITLLRSRGILPGVES